MIKLEFFHYNPTACKIIKIIYINPVTIINAGHSSLIPCLYKVLAIIPGMMYPTAETVINLKKLHLIII